MRTPRASPGGRPDAQNGTLVSGRVLTLVAVALGSNLGDRRAHLDHARARLGAAFADFLCSSYVETDPVGVGAQPLFLNAAAVGTTALEPRALLEALLAIERERRRERPAPGAARTLDLDLILYGARVVEEGGLIVPHPRFRERRFVLGPLAEIAPDLVDPVTGKTVGEILKELNQALDSGL